VFQSVKHRVHLQYATGRPALECGTDVEPPPPLKIRLLKPHGKKQPGHVLTHDYHEAVTLINAGIAEQAR